MTQPQSRAGQPVPDVKFRSLRAAGVEFAETDLPHTVRIRARGRSPRSGRYQLIVNGELVGGSEQVEARLKQRKEMTE